MTEKITSPRMLICSAINWPALSHSQWNNFLSQTINVTTAELYLTGRMFLMMTRKMMVLLVHFIFQLLKIQNHFVSVNKVHNNDKHHNFPNLNLEL